MEHDKWIIIMGNPVEGLNFIGPYDDAEQAASAGNNDPHIDGDWWIAKIEAPGTRG